jgi:hypothetical protein
MIIDVIADMGKATLNGMRRYDSKKYKKSPDRSVPGSAANTASSAFENILRITKSTTFSIWLHLFSR